MVIEVGPSHTKFRVYKEVLTYHSEYFCRALSGTWKEAVEGRVVLEDVEAPICEFAPTKRTKHNEFTDTAITPLVEFAVNWMYHGTLPKTPGEWCEVIEGVPLKDADTLPLQVYILCDRLAIDELKIAVNNNFVDMFRTRTVSYEGIIFAFKNLPADNSLLDYLVGVHCSNR